MNNIIDDDETIIDGGMPIQNNTTQKIDTHSVVDDFDIVEKSSGESRNKNGTVVVETGTKGLIYRVEVFLNGSLLDAKEVDCKDLRSVASSEESFKQRYLNEHEQMCSKYFAPTTWKKLLRDEGDYKEGGDCIITTYMGSKSYKTVVMIDGVELDVIEVQLDKSLQNDENILKAKYTRSHKDLVEKNFLVEKFPVNTFLNPLLKKLPFYKTSPMKSFYLFIVLTVFIMWIISLLVCGKAMKKIVKKTLGTEAALVYKDIQKVICVKDRALQELERKCKNNPRLEECKKACDEGELPQSICQITSLQKAYEVTPDKLEITLAPKSIYISNNDVNELVFKLKERVVNNLEDPTITGDMIISVIGKTELIVKPKQSDKKFEFKLEDTFLSSGEINSGFYTGKLVFEVTGLTDEKDKILEIPIEFNIQGR